MSQSATSGVRNLMLGVVIGTMLSAGLLHAYAWQNQRVRKDWNEMVSKDATAVKPVDRDYTFVPVEKLGDFGVSNIEDFRGFAVKTFGIDKDFTVVPSDALILYKLRDLELKIDKMQQ